MGYHSDENLALMQKQQKTGKGRRGYFYEHGDFPEKDYLDWQIADKSIQDLKKTEKAGKAFFPCRRIYSSSFAFCCASEVLGYVRSF